MRGLISDGEAVCVHGCAHVAHEKKWCDLLRFKGQCYRVDLDLHFFFLMFFSKSFFLQTTIP